MTISKPEDVSSDEWFEHLNDLVTNPRWYRTLNRTCINLPPEDIYELCVDMIACNPDPNGAMDVFEEECQPGKISRIPFLLSLMFSFS